jgi:hypothetical protein
VSAWYKPDHRDSEREADRCKVIAGFLGTAWLAVVLVVLHYFFASPSAKNPFLASSKKGTEPDPDPKHVWAPNYIDQLLLIRSENSVLENVIYPLRARRPRWERAFTKVGSLRSSSRAARQLGTDKALRQVLLAMCDVQLLTGIGILLSGYINLYCYVSSYHWKLVVYLAWFSNLTHLACLTALRSYLHQHQSERNWRLVFMTVLWAGLVPAMFPTAFFNWLNREPSSSLPASSARCFFRLSDAQSLFNSTACFSSLVSLERSDGNGEDDSCVTMAMADTSAMQSAVVSILLLTISYLSRLIKLTKGLSDRVRVTIRHGISNSCTKILAWLINKIARNPRLSMTARRALNSVLVKTLIALYLVLKIYAELLTSDASDVSFNSCPLATKSDISKQLLIIVVICTPGRSSGSSSRPCGARCASATQCPPSKSMTRSGVLAKSSHSFC